MLIQETLEKRNMTKYRLSKDSGVPQATINDICSGKTELERCSAGTLYRIAKVLGLTVEDILESVRKKDERSFELFKSNICHKVKDMGDLDFIVDVLEKDKVRQLYIERCYPETFYLLAMLDYLSRINDIPLCMKYNDIRAQKLSKPVYPAGVMLSSKVLNSDEPLRRLERKAIPEFVRFNLIECEVRDVV